LADRSGIDQSPAWIRLIFPGSREMKNRIKTRQKAVVCAFLLAPAVARSPFGAPRPARTRF